ncbi:arginyltransferase [Malassezia yamatoensis]|uniref:Arginyltransferase n=1 Tax=Malassezia yamatoensis TaxID=253288 RepID=A0AAJ6CJ61_9BASI|nr:arginyltransferase [Malassezia yamatoensis]
MAFTTRNIDVGHMFSNADRGKLIAVGVLDILPHCVSSVYFFYDPDYSHWQLGKIGALNEIALARRWNRNGADSLRYYYLGTSDSHSGYYIHDCQKMRYKSQYGPCEVLDTSSNKWIYLRKVLSLLDQGVRSAFLHQQPLYRLPAPTEEDVQGLPRPLPPGMEDPKDLDACSRDCLLLTIDLFGAATMNDISVRAP